MKTSFFASLLFLSGAIQSFGQAYTGTFYAPDNEDGMLITLNEDQGVYSGTFRGEGEVYQVACKLEDGLLVGTILGKPLHITMYQDGPYLELTLVGMTWGALIDESTARTYVLTLQGPTSSAAADYVQSILAGEQTVIFNGQILSRKQLEDFFKQYQRYPRPGTYWYDPVSGLYGAVGYDAYGYMRKGHNYGPLEPNVSRGDSHLFVNGRCLSKREARVWGQLMGQELDPGKYIFDDRGSFGIEGHRDSQWNLFDLAEKNMSGFHEDLESKHWTSRFGRGRRGERDWDAFISIPGFGPSDYGFVELEHSP